MIGSGNNSTVDNYEVKLIENPVLRIVILISGFLLVGIAILGMILPLLPTTVFLLLAAWCFARSSERFYRWLHYNRIFGKYIRDYHSGNGMTMRSKIVSVTVLWLGILASVIWGTGNTYVRILLILIAVGVTWHLAVIKTAISNPERGKENGAKD